MGCFIQVPGDLFQRSNWSDPSHLGAKLPGEARPQREQPDGQLRACRGQQPAGVGPEQQSADREPS